MFEFVMTLLSGLVVGVVLIVFDVVCRKPIENWLTEKKWLNTTTTH